MINFPVPVNVGDTYLYGDRTWTWNGIGWVASQNASTGYTGSKGDIGYTGSIGQSVRIVGSVATFADAATYASANSGTLVIGDGLIEQDNGHLLVWTGSAFSDVGQIKGDRGDTGYAGSGGLGYTGSTGYTGSIGYTGSASTVAGYVGSLGYTGSKGYVGSAGYTGSASTAAGYTGSRGTDGVIGYNGSVGYTGSIGYSGSASTAPGYTGSVGFTGSAGANGSSSTVTTEVIYTSNTTVSSNTTSGALQVRGGAGIGGNVYIGGSLNSANIRFGVGNAAITTTGSGSITFTSPTANPVVFNGNLGTALNLLANGTPLSSVNSLVATSYTPGTLPVGYSTSFTTRWYPGRKITVTSSTAHLVSAGTQAVQLNILLNDVIVSNIAFTGLGPNSNVVPWSTTSTDDYVYVVVTNNGLYASDLYVSLNYVPI